MCLIFGRYQMCHIRHTILESMGIISNYMVINHLNCLLKAVTPLKVSSNRQRQVAANCDVSPNYSVYVGGSDLIKNICNIYLI